MKLNGWQRAWVVVSVPWLVIWLFPIFRGDPMFPWERSALVMHAIGWPILLYVGGLAVRWVIRGFRKT